MTKTHLTLDDRVRIQHYLDDHHSIRYIAERLDRSPSTISREIKKHHRVIQTQNCDCIMFTSCYQRHLCGNNYCNKLCRTCKKARKYCPDYSKCYCDALLATSNGMCNGCSLVNLKKCHCEKHIYTSSKAQEEYESELTNSRLGYDCTLHEFKTIDGIVTPLVKNGQSIYHILQNHKDELPVSESTIRRMIHNTDLGCRNIDMRSVVQRKIKKRSRNSSLYKKSAITKIGRTYEDYLKFMSEHEDISVVEMDCVEGSKDSNATLLTLHFVQFHMQLAIIMNNQTSEDVVAALDMIEVSLGKELFVQCFELILTDNGHEFMDIEGLERSVYDSQKRTMIFFCEPNRSDEKGSCENNHKLIRYVIPKGTNMESYSQKQILLMMNHINSYSRKALFGKSPYDMAMSVMPEDFFTFLGLEKIPADEIILKPSLINS